MVSPLICWFYLICFDFTKKRYLNDSSSTIIDQNDYPLSPNSSYATNANNSNAAQSYRTASSPGSHAAATGDSAGGRGGAAPHERFSIASSASNLTTGSSSSSRQSWMNCSDIEFDEELPTLAIDRQQLGQLSDKEIKTQEVINELIHTEQKHVRNLKIMKHHFYLPIKVNMYLTKEEINVLFPNLEEVLELHCKTAWSHTHTHTSDRLFILA
jgi:hypothetical protein